eukprot:7027356-Prymnesium_polylepis.1
MLSRPIGIAPLPRAHAARGGRAPGQLFAGRKVQCDFRLARRERRWLRNAPSRAARTSLRAT